MPTFVTTQTVRDSAGELRELHVNTIEAAEPGRRNQVEYFLGTARVQKTEDGRYLVDGSDEVLTDLAAE